MARHTVSKDLFSDGKFTARISIRVVPVEGVPTPDKILVLNRYFRK